MKKTIKKIKDFVKPTAMVQPKRRKEECEIAGEETSEVAKEFLETLK